MIVFKEFLNAYFSYPRNIKSVNCGFARGTLLGHRGYTALTLSVSMTQSWKKIFLSPDNVSCENLVGCTHAQIVLRLF